MARADKDRAFRIKKPPGNPAPQTRHRLRHTAPGRDDTCIAKTCFLARRLAVDHSDGKAAFGQLSTEEEKVNHPPITNPPVK